MITVQRVVVPMTAVQVRSWEIRKLCSTILYIVLALAVIGLGLGLQSAKHKYDEQRTRAQMWLSIVQHMPAAIVVTRDTSEIIGWSDGAERLFGWKAAEVIGSPSDFLLPSEEMRTIHNQTFADEQFKQELYAGAIHINTTDILTKDGKIVRVCSKMGGATNGHKCIVLLYWPANRVTECVDQIAKTKEPIQPQPWPASMQREPWRQAIYD